jgi:hypothetical protein
VTPSSIGEAYDDSTDPGAVLGRPLPPPLPAGT